MNGMPGARQSCDPACPAGRVKSPCQHHVRKKLFRFFMSWHGSAGKWIRAAARAAERDGPLTGSDTMNNGTIISS